MSSDSTGPCVVCGIVIKQRCSSCAEHGFDFFLCGREHQKLVYFAHKRVCGVNANPFRFPPLTAAEAEEAILARDETQSWDRCTLTTVFEELMGIDPPQAPIVIANLQAGGAAHEPPVFSYYGTVNVRYYLSAIAYTRQYGGRRAVLQPTEDLAYVDNPMWMASCAAWDLSVDSPADENSLIHVYNVADNPFCSVLHHVLVYSALLRRSRKCFDERGPELRTYTRGAGLRMAALREEIESDHPAAAHSVAFALSRMPVTLL